MTGWTVRIGNEFFECSFLKKKKTNEIIVCEILQRELKCATLLSPKKNFFRFFLRRKISQGMMISCLSLAAKKVRVRLLATVVIFVCVFGMSQTTQAAEN